MNPIRQFGAFVIHRDIVLGVFRGLFPRRARRRGVMRFGKAIAPGHRKPGDSTHQLGFAGIRGERVMCDWVMRNPRARWRAERIADERYIADNELRDRMQLLG
jgi:hypothetical protein